MSVREERERRILEQLSSVRYMSCREIKRAIEPEFSVSVYTIRRDIDELSIRNLVELKGGRYGGVRLSLKKKEEEKLFLYWETRIMEFLDRIALSLSEPSDIWQLNQIMSLEVCMKRKEDMTKEQLDTTLAKPLLLSVDELSSYLGIGRRTAVKTLHDPNCPYAIRFGSRMYANRVFLERWIIQNTGNEKAACRST